MPGKIRHALLREASDGPDAGGAVKQSPVQAAFIMAESTTKAMAARMAITPTRVATWARAFFFTTFSMGERFLKVAGRFETSASSAT